MGRRVRCPRPESIALSPFPSRTSGTILLLPVLRLEGSPLEFSERRSVTFSSLCNICRQLVGRMGTILQEDVCVQRGLVRTGGKAIVKSPKAQRQPIPLESAALQCSRTVALRNAGIQNEDGRHLTAKDDSGVVLVGHKGLEPLTLRLRVGCSTIELMAHFVGSGDWIRTSDTTGMNRML